MKAASFFAIVIGLLLAVAPSCREDSGSAQSSLDSGSGDIGQDLGQLDDLGTEDPSRPACDALTNTDCIQIRRGESTYSRWFEDYDTLQYDDEGTDRTVIPLADLIDIEVAEDPDAWRYQVYGTDGYTFGGFATWTHMLHGYIELGTRKVVFDPSQELPRSYRVRDAYLITLSPAS